MARTALFFLVLALSIAGEVKAGGRQGDSKPAHKSDRLSQALRTNIAQKVNLDPPYIGSQHVPPSYAAAMTWYRAASKDEYAQFRAMAFNWHGRKNLPEFLQWTWVAPNGDLITRVGKGLFQMSFGNYRVNWFWELTCQLVSWPSSNIEAVMACDDGKERRMLIPGDGTIVIDDIRYRRVFPINEAPQVDEVLQEVQQDSEAPQTEE
jgi:hypothetical protein